MYNKNRI